MIILVSNCSNLIADNRQRSLLNLKRRVLTFSCVALRYFSATLSFSYIALNISAWFQASQSYMIIEIGFNSHDKASAPLLLSLSLEIFVVV